MLCIEAKQNKEQWPCFGSRQVESFTTTCWISVKATQLSIGIGQNASRTNVYVQSKWANSFPWQLLSRKESSDWILNELIYRLLFNLYNQIQLFFEPQDNFLIKERSKQNLKMHSRYSPVPRIQNYDTKMTAHFSCCVETNAYFDE